MSFFKTYPQNFLPTSLNYAFVPFILNPQAISVQVPQAYHYFIPQLSHFNPITNNFNLGQVIKTEYIDEKKSSHDSNKETSELSNPKADPATVIEKYFESQKSPGTLGTPQKESLKTPLNQSELDKEDDESSMEESQEQDSSYEGSSQENGPKNHSFMKKRGKGHIWTQREIKLLVELYDKYDGKWKEIVKQLNGRNVSQCSQKFRKIMKDKCKRKKHKWLPDEDQILLQAIEEYGKDWNKITQRLKDRSCKQARDRYINKLDPSLSFTPWTENEDIKILELYQIYGKRWTLFSKKLGNRSENQVKNRFYYCIQKKYLSKDQKVQIVNEPQ